MLRIASIDEIGPGLFKENENGLGTLFRWRVDSNLVIITCIWKLFAPGEWMSSFIRMSNWKSGMTI